MANLMLVGKAAQIEILAPGERGGSDECYVARCVKLGKHRVCTWSERYDTLDDAVEYAAHHADRG